MAEPTSKNTGILSSVFAVIAFLILIVIVIWGLVHLAGLTGDWFGRFFGGTPSSKAITVTAPQETASGEPFTVTWRYAGGTKGSYALLYQCKDDVQLKAAPRTDLQAVSVPCGTAYTIGGATSVSLTAVTKSASTTLPLSIIFLPSATSTARAQGTATIIVRAAGAQSEDAGTQTQTPGASASSGTSHDTTADTSDNASGGAPARTASPADLTVTILAVGVIDPASGTFVNRQPSSPNDITAVEFDISNRGGTASGTYTFDAQLPTTGTGYYYQSPAQSPLGPGDHVVSTLRFTQMNRGGGTFSVRVDPTGISGDKNTANNIAQQFITYYNAGY